MKTRPGALFIIDATGNSVPSVDRLEQIEAALRRGDPLDNVLRGDLLSLIDYTALRELSKKPERRGRKADPTLLLCAAIVDELHAHHGVKIEAAASALVRDDAGTEDMRRKLRLSIERAHRAYKASGKRYPVAEHLVLEALARIDHPEKKRK